MTADAHDDGGNGDDDDVDVGDIYEGEKHFFLSFFQGPGAGLNILNVAVAVFFNSELKLKTPPQAAVNFTTGVREVC